MVTIESFDTGSSLSSNDSMENNDNGYDMEIHNNNNNEQGEEPDEPRYCTYAVTGTTPMFQAIFVCHDCTETNSSNNDDENAAAAAAAAAALCCICQACADTCHASHDGVEYIGMGPCYCDCDQHGHCELFATSCQVVEPLGIHCNLQHVAPKINTKQQQQPSNNIDKDNNNNNNDSNDDDDNNDNNNNNNENIEYVQDVYRIQELYNDTMLANMCINQAKLLIEHSKETFWVDPNISLVEHDNDNRVNLCALEELAYNIFHCHAKTYGFTTNQDCNTKRKFKGGAEWWVQVKPIHQTNNNNTTKLQQQQQTTKTTTAQSSSSSSFVVPNQSILSATGNPSEAVDLHYDKDEAMAEMFKLGVFPTLSTVTYLSATTNAAPTIIYPHEYTQGEDDVMSSMLVSYPTFVGKHLVFDGRLLHGVPSHLALRQQQQQNQQQQHDDSTSLHQNKKVSTLTRITFLVNIWMHGKPANVNVLDDHIRDILLQQQQEQNETITIQHNSETTIQPTIDSSTTTINKNDEIMTKVATTSSIVSLDNNNNNNNNNIATTTTATTAKINNSTCNNPLPYFNTIGSLRLTKEVIKNVEILKETDLPPEYQGRIELPFTCKGITWEDEDDNGDGPGLIVVTFPPPPFVPKNNDNDDDSNGTINVHFGPGLQAYLDYARDDDDDDDDDDDYYCNNNVKYDGGDNGNINSYNIHHGEGSNNNNNVFDSVGEKNNENEGDCPNTSISDILNETERNRGHSEDYV